MIRGNTCENSEGPINWDHDHSLVKNLVLVPTNAVAPYKNFCFSYQIKQNIDFTIKEKRSSSITSKTKATGSSFIREAKTSERDI